MLWMQLSVIIRRHTHIKESKMNKYARLISMVLVFGAANIMIAQAGCLKGAVVGGVAGHFAHHHAVMGAIAGCAVGHHMAVEKKREERLQRQHAHDAGHNAQGTYQ
jgi:hypothetical protein